jgi:hypothetical protein
MHLAKLTPHFSFCLQPVLHIAPRPAAILPVNLVGAPGYLLMLDSLEPVGGVRGRFGARTRRHPAGSVRVSCVSVHVSAHKSVWLNASHARHSQQLESRKV